MTRLSAVPDRVAIATEKRLQRAVLEMLTGEREVTSQSSLYAAAGYLALCRESRARMGGAA